MGLVILAVLGFYMLVSIGVVKWAIRHAHSHGRSVWRWGGAAALVMYLIPFWDWIPTVVGHKYYCEKEAGFWIYKTLDQWKAENPGVMETLVSQDRSPYTRHGDIKNYTDTYFLNQRFKLVATKTGPFALKRWRREEIIVDKKTNDVLARYVDFSVGNGNVGGEADLPKFWLHRDYCPGGNYNMGLINHYFSDIKHASGGVK